MADWFVARSGQQQGPFVADVLRDMAARGDVTPDDAVWREGMAQWVRAGEVPELSTLFAVTPAPIAYSQPYSETSGTLLTPRGLDLLRQTAPWVRLFGVLVLVFAGLAAAACLVTLTLGVIAILRNDGGVGGGIALIVMTLIYGAFILLYAMPGIYLNRYASRIRRLVRDRREDTLEQALEAQKSFWKFVGVLLLVSVGLWLLAVVGMVVLGVSATRSTTFTFPNQPLPTFPQPQTP